MIMIGAYAVYVGDTLEEWAAIIQETVPKHTIEMNKEALRQGDKAYKNKYYRK